MRRIIKFGSLVVIGSLFLVGCNNSNEKVDSLSNNKSNEVVSDTHKKPINVEETYPQSIEYFKAIEKLEQIHSKEEVEKFLGDFQQYILNTYPYDESKVADKPIIDDVEDFGILERINILGNHIFYEATNHISTIGLNYYVKDENSIMPNSVMINTEDLGLLSKIFYDEYNKYKGYNVYQSVIKDLEGNKNIDVQKVIKELKKISNNYEERKISQGTTEYINDFTVTIEKESISIRYTKDNEFNSIEYWNTELPHNERVYSSMDNKLEVRISIDTTSNMEKQKKLFDIVLGI